MTAGRARRWRPSTLLGTSAGLHVGAGVALALAPSSWPMIAATVVANHAALTAAGLLPRCGLLGPVLTRLTGHAAEGRVALTFDDGPDPRITPVILDMLEAHGARATFFCIGQRVEANPGLAREIRDRGHLVENHSHRHANSFAFLGPRRLRGEILRAADAIEKAVGRRPTLFRAPAGIRNLWLDPVLAHLELGLVAWTRRGFDTVTRNPGRVAARLLNGLEAGDILLLHDGFPARDLCGRPVVLGALPAVLDEFARFDLRSVPLDEAYCSMAG
jgi:peptidoglycan/xylan/chitin deacetylase (PgdA/CDA1 family)